MSETITLPCLSIKQPWAWAILHAGKDFENRTWATKFRGVFLIHAGKAQDAIGMQRMFDMGIDIDHEEMHTGGIVGIARITECVVFSQSTWFFGPYGFKIEDVMTLPFYPCRGRLNFFKQEYPVKELYSVIQKLRNVKL